MAAAWRADAEEQYQQAGLLDNSPQRIAGLGVVRALLAAEAAGKQGISNRLWNQLVPEPSDKVALLQASRLLRGSCVHLLHHTVHLNTPPPPPPQRTQCIAWLEPAF